MKTLSDVPQPAARNPVVIVPRHPTPEMLEAGALLCWENSKDIAHAIWDRMIDVAAGKEAVQDERR